MDDTFDKTTDINIAAFLVCKGHELVGIEDVSEGARQKVFVFEDNIDKTEVKEYWDGASIPAKLFTQTLKELKIRLHQ